LSDRRTHLLPRHTCYFESTRNASTLASCSIVRWSRSSHYSYSWAFKAVKQLVPVVI